MDVAQFPFVDDASRVVGSASYRFTAEEFAAASWAVTIAKLPWYRSRLGGLLFFGFWHAVLACGLGVVVAWATHREGPRGPFSWTNAYFAAVATILSAWFLWAGLYGLDRRLRAAHRKFPASGDDYALAFTPDRYITHTRLVDTSDAWDLVSNIVELRDGFVLVLKIHPGGIWVPDHALHPPFDHQAAAEFLRSKVGKYRVVDRAAAPAAPRRDPISAA